ncbi:hypothetical protein R3P38DRAFT_3588855 [Favolaschia claudopus]|uniref:Uncharacterized protein n=1 Tax=Favolaschia claudopus TaxID=2862362 RepID=A0AAW0AHV5_9AGAR
MTHTALVNLPSFDVTRLTRLVSSSFYSFHDGTLLAAIHLTNKLDICDKRTLQNNSTRLEALEGWIGRANGGWGGRISRSRLPPRVRDSAKSLNQTAQWILKSSLASPPPLPHPICPHGFIDARFPSTLNTSTHLSDLYTPPVSHSTSLLPAATKTTSQANEEGGRTGDGGQDYLWATLVRSLIGGINRKRLPPRGEFIEPVFRDSFLMFDLFPISINEIQFVAPK